MGPTGIQYILTEDKTHTVFSANPLSLSVRTLSFPCFRVTESWRFATRSPANSSAAAPSPEQGSCLLRPHGSGASSPLPRILSSESLKLSSPIRVQTKSTSEWWVSHFSLRFRWIFAHFFVLRIWSGIKSVKRVKLSNPIQSRKQKAALSYSS